MKFNFKKMLAKKKGKGKPLDTKEKKKKGYDFEKAEKKLGIL